MTNIFITGINTEVGKTVASAIITQALEADYWKPIQCGGLSFTDKEKVQELINNPKSRFFDEAYKLKAPQSPHYAAELEGKNVQLSDIQVPKTDNNLVIEGAGGICVPLNNSEFLIEKFSKDTPIILISKHELGSINATLLSLAYLKNNGFNKVGILYNGDYKPSTENVVYKMTEIPILGRINWTHSIDQEFVTNESEKLKESVVKFIQY